jgi:uncharacterized DUF497 family protein
LTLTPISGRLAPRTVRSGSPSSVYTKRIYWVLEFEWDPKKGAFNLREHGVAFEDAAEIFDGLHLERRDDREYGGEERCIAAGVATGRVLIVVYTWRGKGRRIISARKATKAEREEFYRAIHPTG